MNEEVEIHTYRFLDQHGIPYEKLAHPAAYTMEECAAVETRLGAPICKNLFLCNRQQTQFYLLMLPADKPFKTKYLSSQLGCARLSFATEEHMVSLLGIHPGAVSPMGLMNDAQHQVLLVIDQDLLSQEYIGCHPCVNTASLRLRLRDLLERFVPATGHEYRVVELKGE
jgi:Ala-tRNA(Pro) deacylase